MKKKQKYTTTKEDFEKYAKMECDLYNLKTKVSLCVEENIEEYLDITESLFESHEFNLDKIEITKNFVYVQHGDEDCGYSDLEIPAEFLYNQEYRFFLKDKLVKEKEEKLKKQLKLQNKIKKQKEEKAAKERKELFLKLKQEFEPAK